MTATHDKEAELITKTHNTARFCVENPQITWVLLVGTIIWGIYGYTHMPQRKDPDVPPKQALIITPWPGASAEKIEQLVTRSVEKTVASNSNVSRIGRARRTTLGTHVLRADWRAYCRDLHHVVARAGHLRSLCSRSEDREMGDP